ncbi:MAG: beta strand repeat-containing protein [Fimbriiglobus sp.]
MRSLLRWLPEVLQSKRAQRKAQVTTLRLLALEDRAVPATLTITNTNDDATATGPAGSLRRAISDLNSSADATNTIQFSPTLAGTITLQNDLPTITKAVNLQGVGAGVQISGNAKAGFSINDPAMVGINVTISDVSITNTKRTGNGGAVLITNGNVTLSRLVIEGSNATLDGGAISIANGSLNLLDSFLIANSSGDDGGAVDVAGGIATIDRTVMSGNTATALGGSLYQDGGTLNVRNSSFINSSGTFGGGVYTKDSAAAIENSSITNNSATFDGGGLRVQTSGATTVSIRNVTVTGNKADGNGGGVAVGGGTFISTGSTIAFNKGENNGAGASSGGGLFVNAGATAKLFSTLVGKNEIGATGTNAEVSGTVDATSAKNLITFGTGLVGISNADANGNQVGGFAGIDPRLLSPVTNGIITSIPLQATSPAIDTGSNPAPATTSDGRGGPFLRSSGAGVDIGAYEVQADIPLVVTTQVDRNNATFNAADLSLREALRFAGSGAPTVTFAPALNGKTITLNQGSLLTGASVSIAGPGANLLTIDGGSRDAVIILTDFQIPTNNAVNISGLTIQNGAAGEGGLFNGGGGIVNLEALTLDRVSIVNNKSTFSGGGVTVFFGTLNVKNSTISGNSSNVNGGGVSSINGNVVISNSTISGNNAGKNGGGVLFDTASNLVIKNSTITLNKADSDNSGGGKGGGVLIGLGTAEIFSSIVAGNLVGSSGSFPDVSGTAKVSTVVISNTAGLTTTATSDPTTIFVGSPSLDALANNGGPTQTHALQAGGLPIDKGVNPDALTTDQRGTGFNRLTGTAVDIGAFEFGSVGNKVPVAVNDSATTAFNSAASINVLANDSDGDGDALTVTILTNPANGTVVVNGDKTVTYTPTAGFTGANSFTYQINDGKGGLASATVNVTVNALPATTGSAVTKQFAVGLDSGGGTVTLYNQDRSVRQTTTPFPGFTGGVRTATADFDGDGIADIVVGTGPGVPTQVRILSGVNLSQIFTIDPFEASFKGGVYVAAGDVNGDGRPELAITPDEGGGPRIRVFNGNGFGQIADYFGIDDPAFRGGARSTIGDINGDNRAEVIVAAGFGGGPRITIWDGAQLLTGSKIQLANFFAFESSLTNGSFVASGDMTGDGRAEVVFGGGPGGGPRVRIFNGPSLLSPGLTNIDNIPAAQLANFFAGDPNNTNGVRLAVKDLDNDSKADLLTGGGPGSGSRVVAYSATNTTPLFNFDSQPGFTGGVFVG